MKKKINSRKFITVIIASAYVGVFGVLSILHGYSESWLGLTMPILAGTLPAYVGIKGYGDAKVQASQAKGESEKVQ